MGGYTCLCVRASVVGGCVCVRIWLFFSLVKRSRLGSHMFSCPSNRNEYEHCVLNSNHSTSIQRKGADHGTNDAGFHRTNI